MLYLKVNDDRVIPFGQRWMDGDMTELNVSWLFAALSFLQRKRSVAPL
jgi:hypothetical protein